MLKKTGSKIDSKSARNQRRSPCPVSCSLDIFGDRWSLLIVRDMVLGRHRFKEFIESPEKIPTNILTDRLQRLSHHGIIRSFPSRAGSTRLNYGLTKKGAALLPALRAMRNWGLKWEKGTRAGMERVL